MEKKKAQISQEEGAAVSLVSRSLKGYSPVFGMRLELLELELEYKPLTSALNQVSLKSNFYP